MNDTDNDEAHDEHEDLIAVIGMACRFPGAQNIDEFWQNLASGTESISFFSEQELIDAGIDASLLSNPNYIKAKGALENVDQFDAAFFGFSAKEAEITDPQQRLFLECAWEAFEHAGYNTNTHTGPIGVYGGVGGFDTYLNKIITPNTALRQSVGDYQITLSNNNDFTCTRIAYKLNLKGPAITVQTACSTSLVAIIMGYQSLLDYQCDMVLVGGATITHPVKSGYLYQEGMIMSPDGHCRPFDEKAKGTLGGNGVGAVVLKRLEDAIEDGDTIHAVIRGAAINNDGAQKVGYTAPSIEMQAQVITEALALADVSAETIGYVEAHGTATPLGDPIEIAALTQAYRTQTDNKQYCAIGSVKSNIGHLDAAAGVCSFIKTVLALKNEAIPPSLHCEQPSQKLNLKNSPFYINTKLSNWPTVDYPKRAGVSAFGVGGTNAHVILEQAPLVTQHAQQTPSRSWQLIPISAKTTNALGDACNQLSSFLKKNLAENTPVNLVDVAYTHQVGRRLFQQTAVIVAQSTQETINALNNPLTINSFKNAHPPSVVFMFSGQGSQYVNMGLELYQTEPIFRAQIDLCATFLQPLLDLDLRTILYPANGDTSETLKQTSITQPALFVVEYAISHLWQSWGVAPKAMIGHSIGEYVAACLAGVMTLEEALTLVSARGRLIQSLPAGAMLAVPLSEADIQPFLHDDLSLAAVNLPAQSVVSGTFDAITQCVQKLEQQNITSTHLQTSHAFHSNMMTPILDEFLQEVQKIQLKNPVIPYVSNVTGKWIETSDATDPHYWVRHLRQAVRFADGLSHILQNKQHLLLEVGPGRTLRTFAKRHPIYVGETKKQTVLTSLRHPKEQLSDSKFLFTTLGQLWATGVIVDWTAFHASEVHHRIPLPTYPFERKTYWVKPSTSDNLMSPAILTEKNPDITNWFYHPSWKRTPTPMFKTMDYATQSTWLVFKDTCGISDLLIKRLLHANHLVITVTNEKKFSHAHKKYTIDPGNEAHYTTLFHHLIENQHIPDKIVYGWPISDNNTAITLSDAKDLYFYGLIFLAKAISETNISKNIHIDILSNQLQMVSGDEPSTPEKALLLGPCKVIPQEYQQITCRSIDVESASNYDKIIDMFLVESTVSNSDQIVAYRGKHRWAQSYERISLTSLRTSSILRQHGVYLITGGLGGIGLSIAENLATQVQAKLILISRTAIPKRNDWDAWLKNHNDTTSFKIKKIKAIEALGSEVLVLSADSSDFEQMKRAIDIAIQRFETINGVIHTAGVAGGGLIQLKTKESANKILSTKVDGTIILESFFNELSLDLLFLCSSVTSVLAGFGQVDYCSANAYLDAVAQHNFHHKGLHTVCINWDAWQEVGMAVTTQVSDKLKKWQIENVRRGILPSEGIEVFNRALESAHPQILISTYDLPYRLNENHSFNTDDTNQNKDKPDTKSNNRPELNTDYARSNNTIEQNIIDLWQGFLGIQPLGIHDDFFELGGDSLLAVQVMDRLKKVYPESALKPHSLINLPTVAQLADFIDKADASKSDQYSTILVQIQRGLASKKPLFLMHPVGGQVYYYKDLALALGKEQPVYGLQAQGIDGKEEPLTDVKSMASQYVAAILTVQSTGPYYLGGASFGGTLSFEMAQQLHAANEEVALLTMLDTPSIGKMPPDIGGDIDILAYLMDIGDNFSVSDEFRQLDSDQQLNYFLSNAKMANRLLPETTIEQLRQYLKLFNINMQAMKDYKPEIYQGRILFFRAHIRDSFNLPFIEAGWHDVTTGGVELLEVPGNHITMCQLPHVQAIAERLKTLLATA